jgi:hypothetical protein
MSFYEAVKNAKKKTKVRKGMGFKAAQRNIMASGKSKEAAGAILAASARNASRGARKRNPNLKHVR